MPRKVKSSEIQVQRRDNYAYHFQMFAKFQALPPAEQALLKRLARNIQMPGLTIWGSLDYSEEELTAIYALGVANALPDPWLLMPIYTEVGWQEFQRLWKELPEPVAFIHRVGTTYARAGFSREMR